MSIFDADNTEAWVSYLGMSHEEFLSLEALIDSYGRHLGSSGVPLVVVDQSEAARRQIENPETHDGAPVFRIHERHAQAVTQPDSDVAEIRKMLDEFEASGRIRVHRPDMRFYHSQCIDQILRNWSQARFVLLLDSDTLFHADGLLDALGAAYPLEAWEGTTAVGSLVDFVDDTRQAGWKQRLRKRFARSASGRARDARRWRLPRLHPYCLLLHRELIVQHQIDFRLLFLDVLEEGWESDPQKAARMLGDTGSSLVVQSAYHGLRIGDFSVERWVGHRRSASYVQDETRAPTLYEWW